MNDNENADVLFAVNNGIPGITRLSGVVDTNPEDLMIANECVPSGLLNGITTTEVTHLANMLDDATAVEIGSLLADYRKRMARPLRDHVVELLVQKVWDATPDELEGIVQEAKRAGREVWNLVRVPLMKRNDLNAAQIDTCENLPGLELMVKGMAKSDGWLPAPVYHANIRVLRRLIPEATMSQLDTISAFAGKYRSRGVLLSAIKLRDAQLVRIVSRFEKVQGYVLQTKKRHVVIKSARMALRASESQGWPILD